MVGAIRIREEPRERMWDVALEDGLPWWRSALTVPFLWSFGAFISFKDYCWPGVTMLTLMPPDTSSPSVGCSIVTTHSAATSGGAPALSTWGCAFDGHSLSRRASASRPSERKNSKRDSPSVSGAYGAGKHEAIS